MFLVKGHLLKKKSSNDILKERKKIKKNTIIQNEK